jgi:hypothetical protein
MDVEISQGPAPLLNGVSTTNDENGTVPPSGSADAGVLIDFDPIQSCSASTGSASGKADTSGELLLDSFDPLQPCTEPVTNSGDTGQLAESSSVETETHRARRSGRCFIRPSPNNRRRYSGADGIDTGSNIG